MHKSVDKSVEKAVDTFVDKIKGYLVISSVDKSGLRIVDKLVNRIAVSCEATGAIRDLYPYILYKSSAR